MIDQAVALEYIRSGIQTSTGRPCHLAAPGTNRTPPFAVLYPLPIPTKAAAPLERDPGPWRIELQVTSVGRSSIDAAWMGSKVAEVLEAMAPPSGRAAMDVRGTVGPLSGPAEGLSTIVQRWAVTIS